MSGKSAMRKIKLPNPAIPRQNSSSQGPCEFVARCFGRKSVKSETEQIERPQRCRAKGHLRERRIDAIASINRLVGTREFRKLGALSKSRLQFSLIEMLDTTITENAWSKVLAFLFDSRREHGLKKRALGLWVGLFQCPANLKRLALERPTIQVVARTEWFTEEGRRLDILIDLIDNRGRRKGVLGIENKVSADESESQIGDYQKALVKAFPGIPKAILFLTPDGRLPITADPDDAPCPALSVGYQIIIKLLDALARGERIPMDLRRLIKSLQYYIEKEIIMPEERRKEIEALIRKLNVKPSNREAMRLIAEYLPSVKRLTPTIEASVKRVVEKKHPNSGGHWLYQPVKAENPQELKWIPKELESRTVVARTQVALNFMLWSANRNPAIGDVYQFILAAWCGTDADHEKARALVLPKWDDTLARKLPPCWEPLWVGGHYRLHDLGDSDAKGLARLCSNGILATYDKTRKKVFANFPGKK
jgi:PD-(D/E)XK nuclease superfamily